MCVGQMRLKTFFEKELFLYLRTMHCTRPQIFARDLEQA